MTYGIRLTEERQEILKTIYDKYNHNPFLWKDVKNIVSKGLFQKLCSNGFIIKNGLYYSKIPRRNGIGDNTVCVIKWKLELGLKGRYMK